jgi:hypothetical protein
MKMMLNDEDLRILEQPYAPSCVTEEILRRTNGEGITSPGNLRGEDEHALWITQRLALRLLKQHPQ